jgi:hypothetical protein
MEVVTPTARAGTTIKGASWNGGPIQRWGFVDTSKVNADHFLSALRKALAVPEGAPGQVRKPSPGCALTSEELSLLAEASQAVVLGFADCGTSTYYAAREAACLERLGVPAVLICSDAFESAARELAGHFGLRHLKTVVLPHPLASRAVTEIEAWASESAPAIRHLISRPSEDAEEEIAPDSVRTILPDTPSNAQETMHTYGWSDGLPVVAPLPGLVEAMLAAADGRGGDQIMPAVPPTQTKTALERWAANAVLAGCLPSHFPVVLAAMEALLDPAAGLSSSQVATNTSAPLLILNGPIRAAIDAEARYSCLGSGNRANAAIGRAVRLILRNIGGELPGITDLATHGQPGKFSFCLAENEEESPWEPWHVYKGHPAQASTVTTVMASPPQNIFTYGCNTPSDLLDHLIGALTALGHNNIMFDTGPLLLLGPEHAHLLAKHGYHRADVQAAIFERARIPVARLPEAARVRIRTRRSRWFELTGVSDHVGVADRPEDVHLIVTGAPGIHSQFLSTAFSKHPTTRVIQP